MARHVCTTRVFDLYRSHVDFNLVRRRERVRRMTDDMYAIDLQARARARAAQFIYALIVYIYWFIGKLLRGGGSGGGGVRIQISHAFFGV